MKKILAVMLIGTLLVNSVSASSYTAHTSGYLGPNTSVCTIKRSGGDYSKIITFKIASEHRLEHLYLNNINIITSNGSVTGASTSKTNEFNVSYSYGFGNGNLTSASGQFKVVSGNFGNFTKNMDYN